MIFSLSIIAIFVAVSVYFYFRAENLYRQLLIAKKEVTTVKKESKLMIDAFAKLAKKNEESVRTRAKRLQSLANEDKTLALLHPLINNYAMIFRESLKGKGNFHPIAQKCCENYKSGGYTLLTNYIAKHKDAQLKRFWSSNNIGGFVSFVDTVLVELETSYLTVGQDKQAKK